MTTPIRVLAASLLVAFASFSVIAPAQPAETWVLVDTPELQVFVMRGEEVLATFNNVAIGSNGTTLQKRVADERTPLGDYRITEIRRSRRFHLFLGLNYPTMKDAKRALGEDRIDDSEFQRIRDALQRGDRAPQDTSLGGNLGFHGIGNGNPEVHARFNWTNGCIALSDRDMDTVWKAVEPGTPIEIKP